ncbi:MAG: DUF72 domain-containing protein [Deltaproteobacteria bacterium]|nr:DUF72 domain-containing protein [Deltaproteobacteria bacterium]
MIERVRLGLPVWNRPDWTGQLFAPGTPADRRLAAYAQLFNAVEGNTTFYATPPPSTVERWAEQTGTDFRFCFKLPRTVTHDRLLVNARRDAEALLNAVAPLGPRLGPMLVQLPPRFGPDRLPTLEDFLVSLPPLGGYAVEVRHPGYFVGAAASELEAMLIELGVDRVILDTEGMHSAEGGGEALAEAKRRKPRLPIPRVATANHPIVRLVADPDLPRNDARIETWVEQTVQWIEQGREPYLFMHLPDDARAPVLARRLFEVLRARVDVGHLPGWYGERRQPRQVGLFSDTDRR